MSRPTIFKPKISESQRLVIMRALRLYLLRLVRDLDAKRPIGPELRSQADHLEEAFTVYKRFRDRKIGPPFRHWWSSSYDSRLADIYHEIREDEREEATQAEGKAKSPEG